MKKIIKKAEELQRRYGQDDLESLVSKLKAHLFEIPLGRIVKEVYFKDLKAIVVDPNLHPYQKRHLIYHALAHHLFHRKREANYFVDEDKDFLESLKVREKEAEVFAAYFLIPKDKLDKILKEDWVKESFNPVKELAKEFQVPEDLMRKRFKFRRMYEEDYLIMMPLRSYYRLTADKREIRDFPKLPSATSFIRKPLYEIPNPAFKKERYI